MRVSHRRAHRGLWLALTVIVGIAFISAIMMRQETPVEETVFTQPGEAEG
ncbi:MAG: hypothetical protein AAGF58_03615 [Pseudomonadota bacterium]